MLGTRPDITSSLTKLAQYATNYNNTHWTATKRIFRYIRGTSNYALWLGKSIDRNLNSKQNPSEIILTSACDADWARDLDDRRSTSGYIFLLNDHVISWQTHKQQSIATSSTQAEYQALSSATKESIWLRTLLAEIGFKQEHPTTILQDNQSTIALANNPTNHKRTKHIDIAHHYIWECIDTKQIELQYCLTQDMTADIMTKPLARSKFEEHRRHMGIVPIG